MSTTKILRTENGVVLKEITLRANGGTLAAAYSVSTKRVPEVWQSDDLTTANRDFAAEVQRCAPAAV